MTTTTKSERSAPVPADGEWWCPNCKQALGWNRVTFEERCDTCGCAVAPVPDVREAIARKLREIHLALERWDAEDGDLGFGTAPFGKCSPELCGQYMRGANRILALVPPREPAQAGDREALGRLAYEMGCEGETGAEPWDTWDARDKEVCRRIGETLYRMGVESALARAAEAEAQVEGLTAERDHHRVAAAELRERIEAALALDHYGHDASSYRCAVRAILRGKS